MTFSGRHIGPLIVPLQSSPVDRTLNKLFLFLKLLLLDVILLLCLIYYLGMDFVLAPGFTLTCSWYLHSATMNNIEF